MNVTENFLLQQMQAMAVSMSGVPQTGNSKDKAAESGSFQDMLDQAGKANTSQTSETTAKDPQGKDTESKEPVTEKAEAAEPEKAPTQTEEEEELKPELLTANPNAASILDLFRPEVVQPAEEPVIEVPVDAIAEESVEGPDLALDGQMPEMEAGVEAETEDQVPMERQPESFQSAMEEAPQERPAETAEAPRAAEAAGTAGEAPERTERADKLQTAEEAPEAGTRAAADDEPKAEAAETEQPVFHDTRSVPVKVGETYETVDTQKPDMEQKLADTIQAAVQNGAQRVEIHLAPQNLGSLTIEVTKDASGALQVALHASNAKAAGVLNQHLDGLQAALRGYSQEEVRVQVQHNEESQQQNFRQADPDGRGQQQQDRRQQERREEEHTGEAFMQKLRLGLFGTDEI